MLAAILDWLGWERVSETTKRHQEIMAALEDALADLKALRLDVTKVRTENASLRTFLTDRIAALEKIIADGAGNAETIAAIAAEVAGLKTDVAAFDADVPDAPQV